jgi:predicted dehydrogenase
VNVAIVGCGFVADFYLNTLRLHPELRILGLMDRVSERAEVLSRKYRVPQYQSLADTVSDGEVELVLNLTNPHEHYQVSKAALLAGKHVYSEKPLAMQMDQARELVELAESRGLLIASAPCSSLSETAQTLWKVLRASTMGTVRLVYAEMDDGMVPLMRYRDWKSISGVSWPYKDEFRVGCTLEHAGYCLTWLATWFGPAITVTSFAAVQFPDKTPGEPMQVEGPDFSVACIEFASGIVARLTCSILAPHDHSLKIVADKGVLYTPDSWHYRSPVYSRNLVTIRRKTFLNPIRRYYRLPASPYGLPQPQGSQYMDFARGPAELARAARENRACRLSARFSLHVNELALAIHYAREHGATHRMTTRFDPIEPMPWSL